MRLEIETTRIDPGQEESMLDKSLARSLALVCLVTLFTGCVVRQEIPSAIPPVGASTMMNIGPAGGVISIGDLHVTFPRGALASDTMITVRIADPGHTPFTPYSPVLEFEPANLVLGTPIEIRIPFEGNADLATGFAAGGASAAFAAQTTEVNGDVATVHMRQLSPAFVGTACAAGATCTCDAVGQLDLVLVVDDSSSMAEEQALLAAQLPALLRALATGDLDGNGTQDVAAFDDVRVGVTSTDLGLGTASATPVPGCAAGLGDDGVLHTASGPTAASSCPSTPYAQAFASYDATSPSSLDSFLTQIGCVASVGHMGCGLEQQMEAGLLAVSPSAPTPYTAPTWVAPVFPDGRVGQAEMANHGFLRDGSILAVLFLSDEDDCSARDSALFDANDPRFAATELNTRCVVYPDELMPVDEFVRGLVGVRAHPSDIVIGAIAGIPQNVATDDLGALLANPAMTVMIDPARPSSVVPACNSTHGSATPARRFVETMQGVAGAGGHVVLESICDSDFSSFGASLAHTLARRAGGAC
jgi:hypothetical protein